MKRMHSLKAVVGVGVLVALGGIGFAPPAAAGVMVQGARFLAADKVVKIGDVAISGKNQVGKTLTAKLSGVSPETGLTKTYQWYRGDKKISDATSQTYKLQPLDSGAKIRVEVKVTHPGYKSATKASKAITVEKSTTVVHVSCIFIDGTGLCGGATVAETEVWASDAKVKLVADPDKEGIRSKQTQAAYKYYGADAYDTFYDTDHWLVTNTETGERLSNDPKNPTCLATAKKQGYQTCLEYVMKEYVGLVDNLNGNEVFK